MDAARDVPGIVGREEYDQLADLGRQTEAVHRHAKRLGVSMPIAEGMYALLYEGAPISEVLDSLMLRASLYEAIDAPIHIDVNATRSITEHAASLTARSKPLA